MTEPNQQLTGDSETEIQKNKIVEYSKTEAELSRLKDIVATTAYDIKTPQGMKTAISLRAKLRNNRTGIEAKRKEIKAPVLKLGRLIDSEAERIINELLALEKPIDEEIKAEEQRKAEEKRLETERKQEVQRFFDLCKQAIIDCVGKDSAFIESMMNLVSNFEINVSEFLTQFSEAEKVKSETLAKLGEMFSAAQIAEIAAAEAEERKQAILSRMRVFTVELSDEYTLESIAAKRLQIENTVVDALFGEFEQQAQDSKAFALSYLLGVEEKFKNHLEKLKQAIQDKIAVFTITPSDLLSLDSISSKRKAIESIHVDEMFGVYMDEALESKFRAFAELRKAEFDLKESQKPMPEPEEPKPPAGYESWQDYANNPKGDSKPTAELEEDRQESIKHQNYDGLSTEQLNFLLTIEYANDVSVRRIRQLASEILRLRGELDLYTPRDINTLSTDESVLVEFENHETLFWQECTKYADNYFETYQGERIDGTAKRWFQLPSVK